MDQELLVLRDEFITFFPAGYLRIHWLQGHCHGSDNLLLVLFREFVEGLNEAAWTFCDVGRDEFGRLFLEEGADVQNFDHLEKRSGQGRYETDGFREILVIVCVDEFIRVRHFLRKFPAFRLIEPLNRLFHFHHCLIGHMFPFGRILNNRSR